MPFGIMFLIFKNVHVLTLKGIRIFNKVNEIMVHILIKIFIINMHDNYQSYWNYGGEILPRKCACMEEQDPCGDFKIL